MRFRRQLGSLDSSHPLEIKTSDLDSLKRLSCLWTLTRSLRWLSTCFKRVYWKEPFTGGSQKEFRCVVSFTPHTPSFSFFVNTCNQMPAICTGRCTVVRICKIPPTPVVWWLAVGGVEQGGTQCHIMNATQE